MKKLLFVIIAMAVCTTLRGQQINQSNNRYRSYDVGSHGDRHLGMSEAKRGQELRPKFFRLFFTFSSKRE